MRRALFLAYYFPPIGGAGVQRSLKFVRYLPEFGYEPVVVTGPGHPSGYLTPHDATLSAQIPQRAEVLRVPGPEPPLSRGWRRRGERWLRLPAPFSAWYRDGLLAAGRGAGAVDLVYASMSPWESGEIAVRLARELGVPCVADLRDPWVLDEMAVYATRLHRRVELARMRALLRAADAIVMNTAEATARVFAEFPELREKIVVTIPNGFDGADFAEPAPARDDRFFRIVHTGYLHTERGHRHRRTALIRRLLGGASCWVDILTRSHLYLLDAIERVIRASPEFEAILELHLAGVLTPTDRAVAKASFVHQRGYLTHAEAIELMRTADLLFLPMQNVAPGRRAAVVPGKTYEYLAAGRPILAAVPPGDARDVLGAAGNAHLCGPADVPAIEAALAAELERWVKRSPVRAPRPEVVARFERRRLTGELAAVFDAAC